MLGGEGEKISIFCAVCPHGLVSLLSLGFFSFLILDLIIITFLFL